MPERLRVLKCNSTLIFYYWLKYIPEFYPEVNGAGKRRGINIFCISIHSFVVVFLYLVENVYYPCIKRHFSFVSQRYGIKEQNIGNNKVTCFFQCFSFDHIAPERLVKERAEKIELTKLKAK